MSHDPNRPGDPVSIHYCGDPQAHDQHGFCRGLHAPDLCTGEADCTADEHMLCCLSDQRETLCAISHAGDTVHVGDPVEIQVVKIGRRIPVSTWTGPTDEEREALDRKRVAVAVQIPADLARLDEIDDPVARLVLDHHRRVPPSYGTTWFCQGCDAQGYEVDPTDWPCSTVELIAHHFAIGLVDMWIFDRPADGSLDQAAR